MNKFKYYFILLITAVSLFSCSKNDNTDTIDPPIAYAVQYPIDIAVIEDYLKTNYITVVNHPGFADDQDVTFTKIPAGGNQPSIWSYKDQVTFPKLLSRDVSLHDITYKLYYLVLREGVGTSPSNVDDLLISYKGDYLQQVTVSNVTTLTATQFTDVKFPQSMLNLYPKPELNLQGTVTGWSEALPQFKTGTYTSNPDGTISYNDFGAGVMFIPSGLGYYSYGAGPIPAYAPLVFSFKLYEIQRTDQDRDGIPSYQEDLNGDGYMYDFRNTANYPTTPAVNLDDTDGDGIPNFVDIDDDGDKYSTKLEIKNPTTGLPYPFAAIPTCTSGKKNYLDATCHP